MANEVIGSFVFRNEGNGCLTGVWLEHNDPTTFVETCKRSIGGVANSDPFEGNYDVVWIEAGNRTSTALLNIRRTGDIYELSWTSISSDTGTTYNGRGFISEGRLIGCYWNP